MLVETRLAQKAPLSSRRVLLGLAFLQNGALCMGKTVFIPGFNCRGQKSFLHLCGAPSALQHCGISENMAYIPFMEKHRSAPRK